MDRRVGRKNILMRPRDRSLGEQISDGLATVERTQRPLPGIKSPPHREALIEQLLESIHRVRYISTILARDISPLRGDPSSELFDPLKAAILAARSQDREEAFWLVFLSVHFGKHGRTGWRRVRDIYGTLNGGFRWDWAHTSADPAAFRVWLRSHQNAIGGNFGNHRKYESLNADSSRGTGAVVESYVSWVGPPRTHETMVMEVLRENDANGRRAFEHLYCSMESVIAFGRTAKFDYLTMLGKLQLAQIEPGSPHLVGSTGPLKGARLLFSGSPDAKVTARELDGWVIEAGAALNVGMQVMEDALCNWQKNPHRFVAFRG